MPQLSVIFEVFMKRLVFLVLAAATLISCALPLSSCSRGGVRKSYYYEYFDTFSIISDYSGSSERRFNENAQKVEALLREYHTLYDIYNEYEGINNLATLNKKAGEGPVSVDEKIISLLEYGKEIYKLTGGEVNIAFGAVLKIWHEKRTEGKSVPRYSELSYAAKHANIDDIVIDKEKGTVEVTDRQLRIDVGAIAKGYATEKIAEALCEWGINSWALDIGGNIRAVGTKPGGGGWRTGVKNPAPTEEEPYIAYYELKDEALVTSGNYERYYEVGGKRYHHIIDKDTLFPSEHFVSVTVRAESSALADALSTAVFNMELKDAEALIKALGGKAEALVVLPNGEIREIKP